MTRRPALPRGRRAGTASVELALLLPVLTALLFGVADWGLAIEERLRLQTAARAGAQHALRAPADSAGIAAAVRAAAPDLDQLAISSTGVWCECATVVMACSASCASGMGRFIRVGVTRPHAPITPAGPRRVSADVTLRLQ